MSALILGSIAIDDITTPDAKKENLLGGSASYASLAASLFGKTRLVGIVGTDFPKEHHQLFKDRKIDLAGLEVAEGKTFYWSGEYEKNMNNRRTLAVELNVFEKFSPKLPAAYRDTPYVLLANIAPGLQLEVLEQLGKPKFVIADTMDLWIETARPELMQLLRKIDCLIINDSEAGQLSGENNLLRAANWLREQGPRYAVIKKGEHGACLFGPEGAFVAPAMLLDHVVDPTGAGDTFAGGLAGHLAASDDVSFANLKKGVLEGTALASFTVQDFGLHRLASLTEAEHRTRKEQLFQLMKH